MYGVLRLLWRVVLVHRTPGFARDLSNHFVCEVGEHYRDVGLLYLCLPHVLDRPAGSGACHFDYSSPALWSGGMAALVLSNEKTFAAGFLPQVRLQPHRQRERHLPGVRPTHRTRRPFHYAGMIRTSHRRLSACTAVLRSAAERLRSYAVRRSIGGSTLIAISVHLWKRGQKPFVQSTLRAVPAKGF